MRKILLYDNICREHIVINERSIKKENIIDLYCYLKYLKYKILRRYNFEKKYSSEIKIEELVILFNKIGFKRISLICSYYEIDRTIPSNVINLINKYNFDILEDNYRLGLKSFPKKFLNDFEPLFIFSTYRIEDILENINYYEEKFKYLDYKKVEEYFIYNIKLKKEKEKRLNILKEKLIYKYYALEELIFKNSITKEDLEENKSKINHTLKEIKTIYNLYANFYNTYLIK